MLCSCYLRSLDTELFVAFCPFFPSSPVGDLLLGGNPFLAGDICFTSVCFRGSDRTAFPKVLVGVVSREDLLPAVLVTVVVVCLVATVCFLPLVSVTVILFPLLLISLLNSAFLLAIAVWALVPKAAVVRPGSMLRRAVLVRPAAIGTERVVISIGMLQNKNICKLIKGGDIQSITRDVTVIAQH